MFHLNNLFTRIMGIEPVQRQSIITFTIQIAYTLLGFISTMYFAHAVGASVLGSYFLLLAYFGLSGIVSEVGFGGAAIKRISEGEEQDAYFSAFFVLRLLFSTLVIIGLIAFRSYFVDIDNAGLFVWLLLALIMSIFHTTLHYGVAGCGKIGIFSTCTFINNASRIIIQVVTVYLGFEAVGLAGGFVAGMFISFVIELRFLDLHLVPFGWKHIKSLSLFSFWLFLTTSGVAVYSYADTTLIGYFLSTSDVGIYRVAFQLTLVATLATTALESTLFPKVSRWFKINDYEKAEKSLSRAVNYSLLLAIPVFTGGFLLGDKMLYFFYGADFLQGYSALLLLLGVQIANVFQYLFLMFLSASDHQKEAFKITAVAVSLNIILDIALIPLLGITGAAIATLATLTLNALLASRELSKILKIRIEHSSISNIIKASAAMGILVGTYRLIVPLSNVWVTLIPVIFGGVIYGILMMKMDGKICGELRSIVEKMGMVWPKWI